MTRFSRSAAQRADRPDDSQRLASWYTPGLSDGIGDRLLMFDNSTSSSLELLRFRPEFGQAPGFEEALRRRVEELSEFNHPGVAKVRAVEMLGDEDGLALISNQVVGRRLSEILQNAHGPQFATELVRQLMPVLAALEDHGAAHGLVTPERVIVTPQGGLVLTEHVLAPAFERLRLPAFRLQNDLGIVLPPDTPSIRLDDPRTDVIQLGYLALSLLIGQRLRSIDSPRQVFGLIDRQSAAAGGNAPSHLQDWLLRALQLDRSAFESASDAHRALGDWPDRELDGTSPSAASLKHLNAPSVPSQPNPGDGRTVKGTDAAPAIHVISVDEPADFPLETPELVGPAPSAQPTPTLRPPDPPPFRPEDLPAFRPPDPPAFRPADPPTFRPAEPPAFRPADSPAFRPADAPTFRPVDPPAFKPAVPTVRQEPVRLRMDVRPAPTDVHDVPQATAHEALMPPPATADSVSPNRSMAWLAAGLAFIATVEAMVIAGLLVSRVSEPPATTPSSVALSAAATPAAAPNVTAPAAERRVNPTPAAAAPPATGRLEVTTEPAGARVSVGNRVLGTTPLSATLPPGEHNIAITSASGTTRRTVTVAPGSTATVMATLAPAGATGGWLSIDVPVDLQVYEGATLIGTTRAERLMLPAGRHQLRLASTALNFETAVVVDIQAGRTVTTRVTIPNGTISLNALPWANVWVNGQAHGTTPIANLSLPIGTHEVIWRHPQLGERRQTTVVTAKTPARLVVDMRQ